MKWLLIAVAALGLGGCVEDDLYLKILPNEREALLINRGLEPIHIISARINGRDDCRLVSTSGGLVLSTNTQRPSAKVTILKSGDAAYFGLFNIPCIFIVDMDVYTINRVMSVEIGR